MTVTVDDIRAAAAALEGQVIATPCVKSRTLSEICDAELFLKLENLQYTASFKDRGALIKLESLDRAQRAAGVIAVSAGNHAQGVAYHAGRLGIPATIVMPEETPANKVRNTEKLAASVVLHGADLSAAERHALAIAAREDLTLVHPYDDPKIIAGQGTVALEMLREVPDLELLVVPIGGGGLIAGIAIAAKAMNPSIEIIGVEAALFPSMYNALHGLAAPAGGPTIAEGIAVKRPGTLTRPVIESLVADIVLVNEASLERAVQMMTEIEKVVVEGAGAAALAAVVAAPERFRGRRVGLVVSGGNIDSRLLASVLMRGLVREHRLASLRVEVTDQPGSLAVVTALIAELGGNILEVNHQRWFHDVPVKLTGIDFLVETRDERHLNLILDGLAAHAVPARLLSGAAHEERGR